MKWIFFAALVFSLCAVMVAYAPSSVNSQLCSTPEIPWSDPALSVLEHALKPL